MMTLDYILNAGLAGRECISFKINSADSLGRYVILLTEETTPGFVSTKIKLTYWFQDQAVSIGDTIYLYTGFGLNGVLPNTDGTKTYFFYWGQPSTLFNTPNTSVVLMHADEWKYKKVG